MRLINLVVAVGLLAGQLSPIEDASEPIGKAVAQAVQFLNLYQEDNGSWSGPVDVVGTGLPPKTVTPRVLASLLWAGAPADGDAIQGGLDWLQEQAGEEDLVEAEAWMAIALSLGGKEQLALEQAKLLERGRLPTGGWTSYHFDAQRSASSEPKMVPTAVALLALAFIRPGGGVRLQADLRWLEDQQLPDGGWGIKDHSFASEISMVALALSVYGRQERSLQALEWLKAHQESDGSWSSPNSFPRSDGLVDTAWAVIALSTIEGESRATSAGRTFLAGQQKPTGHWGADLKTTTTVLTALCLTAEPSADQLRQWSLNYLILTQQSDGHWSDFPVEDRSRLNRAYLNPITAPALLRNLASNRFEIDDLMELTVEAQTLAEYRTTLAALQALIASGRRVDSPVIDQAVHWIFGQQQNDGSWYGNAKLTIDTVTVLQEAGMNPNTPTLRRAVEFTREVAAFDMISPLVRPLRLAGVPVSDPALSRYLLETLASQTESGAITGELLFRDPEDEDIVETVRYIPTLVDLNAPPLRIKRALAFVVEQQSSEGDWGDSLYTTMRVVLALERAGLAPEAVAKAREWLETQRTALVLKHDDDLDVWPLYLKALGDIALLTNVELSTPRAKFDARQRHSTVLLGGPPGGGNTVRATARLLHAVFPPSSGVSERPIEITAFRGQEARFLLVAEEGEAIVSGQVGTWLSIVRDEAIAGRRLIEMKLIIPDNASDQTYSAGVIVGDRTIPLSIRLKKSSAWLKKVALPIVGISLVLLICLVIRYWKFGPESIFLGLTWGILRVGGTYFIINGAPLAGSQLAGSTVGVLLIGIALLWQLRRAAREDWLIAMAGGGVAAAVEFGLISTTVPWPPGTRECGLVLNVLWSSTLSFVPRVVARTPLGIHVFGLVLPLHLAAMGFVYPPYYPATLWESNVGCQYPIPWRGIPLLALSLYFYGVIGLAGLFATGVLTLAGRVDSLLPRTSIWSMMRDEWSRVRALFFSYFDVDRILSPNALLVGFLVGSLAAFLVNFSDLWLINWLGTRSLLYVFGLSLMLLLAVAAPPKIYMVAQVTNLSWVLALAILQASFEGFGALFEFWNLIEEPLQASIPVAVGKSFILLSGRITGSGLLGRLHGAIQWGGLMVQEVGRILKSGLQRLGGWLAQILKLAISLLGRVPVPRDLVHFYRRWQAISVGQTAKSALRGLSLVMSGQIGELGKRFKTALFSLKRILLSLMHSPRMRHLAELLVEVTGDNLMLNLLLLAGFWLDVLRPDLGAVLNAVRLFRWDLSNPFLFQFLILEMTAAVGCLVWWLAYWTHLKTGECE